VARWIGQRIRITASRGTTPAGSKAVPFVVNDNENPGAAGA
jgi:hypothetical protein